MSKTLSIVLSAGQLLVPVKVAHSQKNQSSQGASKKAENSPSVLRDFDFQMENFLSLYDRIRAVFSAGKAVSLRQFGPLFLSENWGEIASDLETLHELPEIFRSEKGLLVRLPEQEVLISEKKLQEGFFVFLDRKIPLDSKISYTEAKRFLRSSQNSKIFKNLFLPEAQAAAGPLLMALGALIATLLGKFFWDSSLEQKKADEAYRKAIATNAPLDEQTLGPSVLGAPTYNHKELTPLNRIGALVKAPAQGREPPHARAPTGPTEKILEDLQKNRSHGKNCGSAFHQLVLEEIQKMPTAGGYDIRRGGFNQALRLGPHSIAKERKGPSMCSSATYTVFLRALEKSLEGQEISNLAASHFQTGKNDNFGVWGIWNNNYGGAADVAHYLNGLIGNSKNPFGSLTHNPLEACPGDFLKFDRDNGSGHSVIFLGFQKGPAGQEICYWSSNKKTKGYGIQCETARSITRYNFLKVENPKAILGIKEAYSARLPWNGKSLYSQNYAKLAPQATQEARFAQGALNSTSSGNTHN